MNCMKFMCCIFCSSVWWVIIGCGKGGVGLVVAQIVSGFEYFESVLLPPPETIVGGVSLNFQVPFGSL